LIATHRVAFFLTLETHVVIVRLCLLLPTPLALSPQKVTPVPTTLALPLLRRSLARSVCSYVSVVLSCSPPPAMRALRITLNFSPHKASVAAGRSAGRVRDGERGQRTSTAPSSALLPRPRERLLSSSSRPCSPHRKSSSRWKLIAPFIEVL
jgi:hypothetical protein